jgi:ATP-dependent Clp protease, protease subunit
MFLPIVVEQSGRTERSFDIYSRLLRDRIIMLNSEVNEASCGAIGAQFLYLAAENKNPIHFYINSGGGSVMDGYQVYNIMQLCMNSGIEVHTYVNASACSMASLLASSGTKGKRYMLPKSRHMIHMVSSGTRGTVIDMQVSMNETARLNDELTEIYSINTGKSIKQLKLDMARDFFMTAEESIKYGLADSIITKM